MNDQINSFLPSDTTVVDADRLRGTVEDLAGLVEDYSLKIQAIANAASRALETEWGVENIEDLAHLLEIIGFLASNLNDTTAHDAAQVGVAAKNDRVDARQAARLARWSREHGGKANA